MQPSTTTIFTAYKKAMGAKTPLKILYDTDFLIALFLKDQSTHQQAKKIFHSIEQADCLALNLVKYELATVLSYKFSYEIARDIMLALQNIPLHYLALNEQDEKNAWQEFFTHKNKGISFVDCANLALAKKQGFKIASFDAFYPKEIRASEENTL
jgi:predicted nucleic acid-binding protein